MPLTFCVSEEDAKTKWCPMGREGYGQNVSTICRGSGCMMWRYVMTNISDGQGGMRPSGDTHGYCGLAGAPPKL